MLNGFTHLVLFRVLEFFLKLRCSEVLNRMALSTGTVRCSKLGTWRETGFKLIYKVLAGVFGFLQVMARTLRCEHRMWMLRLCDLRFPFAIFLNVFFKSAHWVV